MPRSKVEKRHAMGEFGVVYGATQEIRVNRLEKRLQPLVPFPHQHDFYHLLLVRRGSGWHEIDFARYSVRANQAFVMKPGQVHSWKIAPATRGYVVEFGPQALTEAVRADAAVAARIASIGDELSLRSSAIGLLELGEQMLREYERRPFGFETALRQQLTLLLLGLGRLADRALTSDARSPSIARDPMVTDFLALVEERFRTEHGVSYYAGRLKITPAALTMRISRALGRSARAVIQERCVLEARRLLVYSDLRSAEVGYALGFDDPNYFSRQFKAATGQSPSEFRARARGDSA